MSGRVRHLCHPEQQPLQITASQTCVIKPVRPLILHRLYATKVQHKQPRAQRVQRV